MGEKKTNSWKKKKPLWFLPPPVRSSLHRFYFIYWRSRNTESHLTRQHRHPVICCRREHNDATGRTSAAVTADRRLLMQSNDSVARRAVSPGTFYSVTPPHCRVTRPAGRLSSRLSYTLPGFTVLRKTKAEHSPDDGLIKVRI